uniref:Apolipoprotein D n=1 Tax=Lates calcarifer TaxID=8187 RepID=A0A4W6DF33_LATCA
MSAVYLLVVLLLPLVSPNFNLQQYLGKWYEIEKLPAAFERGKCIEANYAIRKDVLRCPYLVLTTDYTTLSVVYSCTDILRLFHVEYAWILGRSRFLPPETVRYAKNLLISEGIDLFRMKATDQMGCKDY